MKDLPIIVDKFEMSNSSPSWKIELPDAGYIVLPIRIQEILNNWDKRRKKRLKEMLYREI